MGRVLVTRRLPRGGLGPLAGHELLTNEDDIAYSHDALVAAARDVDAILCLLTDRIDATVIEAGAALRVVANVAVGYDNIDLDAAARHGVVVCNTPDVLTETTADLAWALILAASRRLSEAEADLRAGRWPGWGVTQYLGRDVHGSTLGVVGHGRIGRAVARRAEGFGMHVVHHARRPTGKSGWMDTLDALLDVADIVSLHVPLDDTTHHLIGARELERMKSTAVLVNTSRGPAVDEGALATALQRRTIFAAGLDVYEDEPTVHPDLLESKHVTLLPHIGSASDATRTSMARLASAAVAAVLGGRTPPNVVGA